MFYGDQLKENDIGEAHIEKMRNACKILVRKTEGKTLLGILNFK
jgi:hypothetical protein